MLIPVPLDHVILLLSLALANGRRFQLPEAFIGTWQGTPEYSMLGPYSNNTYTFSISVSEKGDILFQNSLVFDEYSEMGYQRFYVEGYGENSGALWYCGALTNFSNEVEEAGRYRLDGFKATSFPTQFDTSVTFCLDSNNVDVMQSPFNPYMPDCQTCDCANWTLSYDVKNDILSTQMSMSGSDGHTHSKHLWAQLHRVGDAPDIQDSDLPGHGADFSCAFEDGGRDSVPVENDVETEKNTGVRGNDKKNSGCPVGKHHTGPTSPHPPGFRSYVTPIPSFFTSYEHCYVLNALAQYSIQWTLDIELALLHVAVSAPIVDNNTYVAVGFRPLGRADSVKYTSEGTGAHRKFGMQGADIVAGSLTGGVRTTYAELYTGPPVPDSSLQLLDANISTSTSGDRVVLAFTRPLVSGYLLSVYKEEASIVSAAADLIWATGQDEEKSNDNQSGCAYHSNSRGLRMIDWENPEVAMKDEWKC